MTWWRSTRALLAIGLVAPAVFVCVALAEGAVRPGYDPVRQYVSLLSLGPTGWTQVVNFIVTGILVAGFGVGLRRVWAEGPAARWVPRLVVGVGVGLLLSGVFVTDPAQGYPAGAPTGLPTEVSWHAGIHYIGALIVFVGLAAAIAIASWRPQVGNGPAWRVYSLVSAVALVGFWLATFAFPGTPGTPAIAGLLQRIAVVAGFQWLAVTAALEFARSAPAAEHAYA